jgi:nitrous oxidase accessory protein
MRISRLGSVPALVLAGAAAFLIALHDVHGLAASAPEALQPLQSLIDAAESGATITPAPGRYAGPVVISRPVTLDGAGRVTIDGGGKGTVLLVKTDGATVRGVHVTGSGDQHNNIDAGIRVEGRANVVKDNVIDDCLFGIDLQQSSDNIVRRNRITSKSDAELGLRGDAIRLWYAANNRLEENVITGSRDLVVWYSAGNSIRNNEVRNGRYGLHFMYGKDNLVENNLFEKNLVGISIMYDEGDVIRGNHIFAAQGAAGVGVGFKEASNLVVEGNDIDYNAVGLSFDISPFQPDSTIRVRANTIAFNDIGVSFLSNRPGSIFKDNVFLSNTQHVAMRLFETASQSQWARNYWDDYEGFDRNHDGFGDTPYVMRSYADRLWMDVPSAAFFKGSPALTSLDFIERLAPFTEPLILLKDEQPRMTRTFAPSSASEEKTGEAAAPGQNPADGPSGATSGMAGPSVTLSPDQSGRLDPFGLYKN